MSLKLYGHNLSLCTRRVLLVLAEKGLKYDFEVVDFLKGEHKVNEARAPIPWSRANEYIATPLCCEASLCCHPVARGWRV